MLSLVIVVVPGYTYFGGGDVVPPDGGLAGDFAHLQFIWGLVDQSVERTHSNYPGQVKTAHLDTDADLEPQTQ